MLFFSDSDADLPYQFAFAFTDPGAIRVRLVDYSFEIQDFVFQVRARQRTGRILPENQRFGSLRGDFDDRFNRLLYHFGFGNGLANPAARQRY